MRAEPAVDDRLLSHLSRADPCGNGQIIGDGNEPYNSRLATVPARGIVEEMVRFRRSTVINTGLAALFVDVFAWALGKALDAAVIHMPEWLDRIVGATQYLWSFIPPYAIAAFAAILLLAGLLLRGSGAVAGELMFGLSEFDISVAHWDLAGNKSQKYGRSWKSKEQLHCGWVHARRDRTGAVGLCWRP